MMTTKKPSDKYTNNQSVAARPLQDKTHSLFPLDLHKLVRITHLCVIFVVVVVVVVVTFSE
jgi:hypothetical protein